MLQSALHKGTLVCIQKHNQFIQLYACSANLMLSDQGSKSSFMQVWQTAIAKLPRFCLACNQPCWHLDLCPACLHKLPWITHLPNQSTHLVNNIQSLFSYEDPVRFWIHQLKFRNRLIYAQLFSQLMHQNLVLMAGIDAIVSVPMHAYKIRQRGYNQSHLIAKQLSRHLNISYPNQAIIKHRQTDDQHNLSPARRQQNLKNCFQVNASDLKNHQGLLIIDDVITTKATIHEMAKTIRCHFNGCIQVWSICRNF